MSYCSLMYFTRSKGANVLTEILQIVVILVVLTVLVVPTGTYMANIFTGERHLLPERLTYRLLGVDPNEEMNWKRYAVALVLASGAAMLLGYVLLRLQSFLPLNPLGLPPQDPDQAFNTPPRSTPPPTGRATSGRSASPTSTRWRSSRS